MTIKLYDKDAYQTIFEAQVITCTKRENDYDIVLDQTLFFPEEGGQTCDHGTLNDVDKEIEEYSLLVLTSLTTLSYLPGVSVGFNETISKIDVLVLKNPE